MRLSGVVWFALLMILHPGTAIAQRYTGPDGRLRVALVRQPYAPTGLSAGPATMANGGIQSLLAGMGVTLRSDEATLTALEATEYGGWKKLGMALGHFAGLVARNERDGYFTVGLLATCPSMPGLVAGLQRGSDGRPVRIGMLWLDAHPDFNTPETTRSGSLGGMPVAVATGRALHRMRRDATLDPPLEDRHVVMAGVRLTDPLEQELLDRSAIEQVSVEDLRRGTPVLYAQLDRLARLTDKLYIHIDLDVLDPREVAAHQNKVPGGPTSEELAVVFETIFRRYPTASAIGFATIPSTDEGGLGIAAVNRMIAAAVRGVQARERPAAPRDSANTGPAYAGPAAPLRATRPCRISRIIDGDTVQCEGAGRVRLIGVDAPERDQGADGAAAARALADLLPRGSTPALEPDVTARDQFGRLLGYLWRDGRLVNWELVRSGWAVTLTYPPNVQYAGALSEAQRLAERARAGLWARGAWGCRPVEHRAGKC